MLRGDVLPLELRGETPAAPAGEGVGLEEAEVANRCLGELLQGMRAVQRKDGPAGSCGRITLPVERSRPAVGAHGTPALGEPQLGTRKPNLLQKGEIFGEGD